MKASVEKLSEARLRLHRGASPGAAEKLRSSYDELTDIVASRPCRQVIPQLTRRQGIVPFELDRIDRGVRLGDLCTTTDRREKE
jgi:hypothetical protein